MLTISARETVRHVVGTMAFVLVVIVAGAGAIGAGLFALSTVGPLDALSRSALAAAPEFAIAGVVGLLGGTALIVAGAAVLALDTVASGVRIGLDRTAALDRPLTPGTASRPTPPDRPERHDPDPQDGPDPRPADWTEANAVERSRAPAGYGRVGPSDDESAGDADGTPARDDIDRSAADTADRSAGPGRSDEGEQAGTGENNGGSDQTGDDGVGGGDDGDRAGDESETPGADGGENDDWVFMGDAETTDETDRTA
ncbi:MAG: hypothetical protein ABEJ86_04025 [Halococcoides sp.]